MDQSQRRERIRANLGIKPITHGQIYTFQIAIPDALKQDIAIEQQEAIADSLLQHGSNFFPIIVRPTEDYGEDEEYEVVYGADWCQVAKDIDIEKVWVWVFDLNDEQASATREELESLISKTEGIPNQKPSDTNSQSKTSLSNVDFKKIEVLLSNLFSDFSARLEAKVDELLSNKLDSYKEQIKEITLDKAEPSINSVEALNTFSLAEIKNCLRNVGLEKKSKDIVDERDKNGKFKSFSDIEIRVKGIGPASLRKIESVDFTKG